MDSPTTPTGHIFISYEHDDQAYTRKLRDSLRQRGFEVWMDEHLESGDRWLRTIEQAVRDSAAVVVVMTPEARESEWVEREILLAQDESKPIFPLLLRGGVFFLLVTKQYTDVTGGRMPPDEFYERLEREVRARSREEIMVRKDRPWGWYALGLMALVVLIGVLVNGLIDGGGGPTLIPKLQPPPNASLNDTWTRPTDGMEMVYVPDGTFEMGSTDVGGAAQPVHTVTLDSFWIDRTEVTNAQYAGCVAAGVCSPPSESSSYTRDSYYGDSQFDDYPVIYVGWEDADTYCQWAGGRLPREAEWEYAARGPEGRVYPWGNDPPDDTLLNYNLNVGDTTPVGSYAKGESWVGALDMAGNVWEWVNDWYADYYYAASPAENPTGPDTGDLKVLRGGSWIDPPYNVRSAYRTGGIPDLRNGYIGFRCVVASTSSP